MRQHTRLRLLCCAGALALLAGCAAPGHDGAGSEAAMTAQSKLRLAKAAEDTGNHDMAAAMYGAAAAAAPGNNDVQLHAAEGLARNGKLPEAETLLDKRLQAAPDDVEMRRALGGVEILTGHPQQAVDTFSRVLAVKADDLRAMTNMGVALDMLHRYADAQALYRKALAAAPNDPAICNDLALSLMQTGRLAEARQVLEPFRNAGDVPERIGINLGLLDAASGQVELAQPALAHVKSDDLTALTQAIRQESGGQTTQVR
ncbi:MAG TPA: tetratricopeptide repeat protein [Rhodopila sp.]|nr:tetratricopeptide repeat protein [Rhodopila sp.]